MLWISWHYASFFNKRCKRKNWTLCLLNASFSARLKSKVVFEPVKAKKVWSFSVVTRWLLFFVCFCSFYTLFIVKILCLLVCFPTKILYHLLSVKDICSVKTKPTVFFKNPSTNPKGFSFIHTTKKLKNVLGNIIQSRTRKIRTSVVMCAALS